MIIYIEETTNIFRQLSIENQKHVLTLIKIIKELENKSKIHQIIKKRKRIIYKIIINKFINI